MVAREQTMKEEDFQSIPPLTLGPKCEQVYNFQEIIGEGSYSSVVRAIHSESSVQRAVKVIEFDKMSLPKTNDQRRWRIHNEMRLHKLCAHPHVVELHETFETEVDACLVMELCEGGELFDRIKEKGCFSERDAARIMRQIGSAVKRIHQLDIVHRDIKPENLLFRTRHDDSDIKLADFGLALVSTSAAAAALTGGTPAYCAPERFTQSPQSKAVDMWSLGCILYFLLFGKPPFGTDTSDEEAIGPDIEESVSNGVSFPSRCSLSDSGKDLILRLLNPDPERRLTVDGLLRHSWVQQFELPLLCEPSPQRSLLRSSSFSATR